MFYITGGKGFQIEFENGWTVSVQFGGGSYCSNRDDGISDEAWAESGKKGSTTAEIAAWDKNNNWHKFEHDNVEGWVTPDKVAEFINMIAKKAA